MKKRGFGEGRWNGVGGKLEDGESIEAAMRRETQEEICVTPIQYEQVADLHFDEYFKGAPTVMNVHVFIAREWDGEPTESEEMRPEWFDVERIPYDDMWPDDPYWLPQVLYGQIITADFTLDQDDAIVSHNVGVVAKLPE
jgi:8-oxo-dGTP pyrophosphatase MutT (NUDIX family)